MVARVTIALAGLDFERFTIYSSKHHLYQPSCGAVFVPDVSVVKDKPEIVEVEEEILMTTNPRMVIEVLSDTTRAYDLGIKLPRYRQIESMRHILYVEQDRPMMTLHTRIEGTDRWRSEDYDHEHSSLLIGDQVINVAAVYRQVYRQS